MYASLAVLGLCCGALAISACRATLAAVCRLRSAVAPLVTEHGSRARALQWLQPMGSRARAQRLCPRGPAFPWHVGSSQTRNPNLCPLHWQADS